MASTGATVVAVEIDPAMADLTREATAGMINVRVLNVDALAGKNKLNPEVLDNVRSGPGRRARLDGSNWSRTSLIMWPHRSSATSWSTPSLRPERVVATIQLELAQRMMAGPDIPTTMAPSRS